MTLDALLATARVIADSSIGRAGSYVGDFARSVLAYHSGDVSRLSAELVAWAKRWRSEACSHEIDCDAQSGAHSETCAIRVNEIDGCALVDALAVAEAEQKAKP